MNEKPEGMRAWFAPGIVVALIAYGVTGVTIVRDIDHRSQSNARDIARNELRLSNMETVGGASSSRMAVMETQLGNVLEFLERIDARMEDREERR